MTIWRSILVPFKDSVCMLTFGSRTIVGHLKQAHAPSLLRLFRREGELVTGVLDLWQKLLV